MTKPEIIINRYETAIFPKDFFFDTKEIKEKITKSTDFNKDDMSGITLPDVAPRNIPRIIFLSEDGTKKLSISFEKIGIEYLNVKEDKKYKISLEDRKKEAEEVFNIVAEGRKIKRVGHIKEIFVNTKTGYKNLEKLLQTNTLTKLKNIRLSFTYTEELKKHKDCNKVVTLVNGKTNDLKNDVIILTNDLNTSQDSEISWKLKDVLEFMDQAEEKSKISDIAKYLK